MAFWWNLPLLTIENDFSITSVINRARSLLLSDVKHIVFSRHNEVQCRVAFLRYASGNEQQSYDAVIDVYPTVR